MKKMFMVVIALMMTISASAQFYIYCNDGNVIKVDSISMVSPGIGVFSVAKDKQITFSLGNLQYTQSTNTWAFAENQYNVIGAANVSNGALADKIDLFGWSADNTTAPFGVSTIADDTYYSGSFVDWGTNQIGSDAPNTWRTLTYDEWNYLCWERPNFSELCGVAQVNGVNGLILLPDSWTCPLGVTFKSGFHNENSVETFGQYQTFTVEQWSKLEAAGAVFLPSSGYRNGSDVKHVQNDGEYWSATEVNNDRTYVFNFYSHEANMYSRARSIGRCIRLVRDL
jgi:hypothetical protein